MMPELAGWILEALRPLVKLRTLTPIVLVLVTSLACSRADSRPQDETPRYVADRPEEKPARLPGVPYVPTPEDVVEEMLTMARVGGGDVVFDLGCGDGRIVVAAIRDFGARRGVCVEIEPRILQLARDKAAAAGVADRIEFVEGDLFETELGEATVVALYLLASVNLELRPKLFRELRPGTRVVSHDFHMGQWYPEKMRVVGRSVVYLWTIPAAIPEGLEE